MKKFVAILFSFLLTQSVMSVGPTPEEIVRDATNEVLKWINKDREELKSDPEYLRILIEELILPHFDFTTMSQLVLDDHWGQLSEADQACFAKGFRNLLTERYADILLSYNNHSITYDPVRPVGEEGYMSVRQTISRDGAKPLPVEYPMRPDENGWKIVDLIIDEVSLLTSYRKTFNTEINTIGLDEFIHSFPDCNPVLEQEVSLHQTSAGSQTFASL